MLSRLAMIDVWVDVVSCAGEEPVEIPPFDVTGRAALYVDAAL